MRPNKLNIERLRIHLSKNFFLLKRETILFILSIIPYFSFAQNLPNLDPIIRDNLKTGAVSEIWYQKFDDYLNKLEVEPCNNSIRSEMENHFKSVNTEKLSSSARMEYSNFVLSRGNRLAQIDNAYKSCGGKIIKNSSVSNENSNLEQKRAETANSVIQSMGQATSNIISFLENEKINFIRELENNNNNTNEITEIQKAIKQSNSFDTTVNFNEINFDTDNLSEMDMSIGMDSNEVVKNESEGMYYYYEVTVNITNNTNKNIYVKSYFNFENHISIFFKMPCRHSCRAFPDEDYNCFETTTQYFQNAIFGSAGWSVTWRFWCNVQLENKLPRWDFYYKYHYNEDNLSFKVDNNISQINLTAGPDPNGLKIPVKYENHGVQPLENVLYTHQGVSFSYKLELVKTKKCQQ